MHLGNSIEININEDPTYLNIVYLGNVLDEAKKAKAMKILKRYAKVFFFNYQDMLGMYPNVIVHNIVTHLDAKFIKQKPKRVNPSISLQIKDDI